MLSEIELSRLRGLYERYPHGWEPVNPKNALLVRVIDAGYLKRVDGRCGFERFKDSHVAWTEAGKEALRVKETIDV